MPVNDHVVIEDPSGARATVGLEAVPHHQLRGFTVIGAAIAPGDPRTPEEAAKEAADEQSAVTAVAKTLTSATKSGASAATKKEK
jgi:hypothetical protein